MQKFSLFISTIILLVMSGCEKPVDGGISTNTIVGFIELADENGNIVSDKSNGIIVLYSPDSLTSELTDASGRVIIENVPSGTYNVKFSKEGYGEYMDFGTRVAGGPAESLIGTGNLFKKPVETISNLSIIWNGNYYIIAGDISPNANELYLRFFFSNDPSVSSLNYATTNVAYISEFDISDGSHFQINGDVLFTPLEIYDEGSTIHVKAYATHMADFSGRIGYFDEILEIDIFSGIAINGSQIVSYTLQSNK